MRLVGERKLHGTRTKLGCAASGLRALFELREDLSVDARELGAELFDFALVIRHGHSNLMARSHVAQRARPRHDWLVTAKLRDLRAKYEEMRALRMIDAPHDPRERMAALAATFPGALREIDELPLDEIDRRIEAIGRAESDASAITQWMRAMTRFHALARGALYAKRSTATDPATWPTEARVWERDLSRIENPPRGRIMDLVYERLALEFATTPQGAKDLIFRNNERTARHGDTEKK